MLIATIVAILFLGGGGAWFDDELSQLKKNTKEVVESGEVRDEALNIIKEMKKLSSDQGKLAKSRAKQISSLLEDRTVGQAELDAVIDGFQASTVAFQQNLTTKRFELKEKVTREQWAQMYAGE
jgi:hypothetical protein